MTATSSSPSSGRNVRGSGTGSAAIAAMQAEDDSWANGGLPQITS